MVQIGKLAGRSVKAILTNMDEPLGPWCWAIV